MRLMRSSVLQVKPNDYVQAARALGATPLRIIRSHILPNALASVIVVSTINLGVFIAVEATLSFLGIGLQPPAISWGIQISEASGHRADPGGAAHAALPEHLPVVDRAGVHHAGRRGPRRPRPEDCAEEASMAKTIRARSRRSTTGSDLAAPATALLLEVDELQVEFRTRDGVAKAINGVSFDLRRGRDVADARASPGPASR